MATRFIIRLYSAVLHETAPVSWHSNQTLNAPVQHGAFEDAVAEYKKHAASLPLFVAVPAAMAPEAATLINAAQKRKLSQVLPFLFEDKIAEDIEDVHFAVTGVGPMQCTASYIKRTLLDNVLELLKKHEVNVHWLGADIQLLARERFDSGVVLDDAQLYMSQGGVLRTAPLALAEMALSSVLASDESVNDELVKHDESDEQAELEVHAQAVDVAVETDSVQEDDDASAFDLDTNETSKTRADLVDALDVSDAVVADAIDAAAASVTTVYISQEADDELAEQLDALAARLGLAVKRTPALLSQMAEQAPALQAGNLLAGDYSGFRHRTGGQLPWKAMVAVAAFFVVSFSALNIVQGMRYQALAEDVVLQQKALYVGLYPEAKGAKSNFKVRMQSKLTELMGDAAGDSEGTFAEIFDKTSKIVAQQQNAELIFIEQARYNNSAQKMDLVITAKSLGQLDTLKNALDEQGLAVSMGSVVNTDKGTRVKFTIGKLTDATV